MVFFLIIGVAIIAATHLLKVEGITNYLLERDQSVRIGRLHRPNGEKFAWTAFTASGSCFLGWLHFRRYGRA